MRSTVDSEKRGALWVLCELFDSLFVVLSVVIIIYNQLFLYKWINILTVCHYFCDRWIQICEKTTIFWMLIITHAEINK